MSAALQTLLQTALLQRPRPWRIVGDGVVEDANGQEVCTIDTQRNLDDDVAAALAQLIAGAPMVEAGAILRHRDGRTGAFVSVEDDGRYRVQSLMGSGFWIFHPDDCVGAPDDHVSDARQMVEAPAEAGEWITGDQLHEIMQSFTGRADVSEIAAKINAAIALRAQPQAREEAQPVTGMRVHLVRDKVYGDLAIRHWASIGGLTEGEHILYLHPPAPSADKLRDAVLEEAAAICEDVTSWGLSPTKAEVAKSTQTFCAKAIRAQKSEAAK